MNRYAFIMAILSLLLLPGVSQAESGPDNYRTYCMQCHGMHANGLGVNTRDMTVGPLEHSSATMMAKRSDSLLFKAIKEGGLSVNRSALMPPWGDTFTDDEINDLVKYLRKLCKCKWAGY